MVETPEVAGEVEIEVAQLGSSEEGENEQESSEGGLALEEAPNIAQPETGENNVNTNGEPIGKTSKKQEGNDTERGPADQAEQPDGGATL